MALLRAASRSNASRYHGRPPDGSPPRRVDDGRPAAALRGVLTDVTEDGGSWWQVTGKAIIADDVLQIQRQVVVAWADGPSPPNLIVTTGGTGFAVADGTPEVPPRLTPRVPSGRLIVSGRRPSLRYCTNRPRAWCTPC